MDKESEICSFKLDFQSGQTDYVPHSSLPERNYVSPRSNLLRVDKDKKFQNYKSILSFEKPCRISTFSFDGKVDLKCQSKYFPQQKRF